VSGPPQFRLLEDPEQGAVVELRGLTAIDLGLLKRGDRDAAGQLVAVFTGEPEQLGPERLPVAGRLIVRGSVVRWLPSYPLPPGQRYVLVWKEGTAERHVWPFGLPAVERASSTYVSGIYPDTDAVPENLLRIYIQFSAPMSRGRAREFIELTGSDGEPITGAFVVPEQELWSTRGDRLTLFFDPGRIKRQVGPNLSLGTPLRAGQEIRLVISGAWPDADGVVLQAGSERSWSVRDADRRRPATAGWNVVPPSAQDARLMLRLPEPLDRALMERMIQVQDATGALLEGDVEVQPGQRFWSFHPAAAWVPGSYAVRVDPQIEDLAGNSLERLFDEPLREDRIGTARLQPLRFRFEVRPPNP